MAVMSGVSSRMSIACWKILLWKICRPTHDFFFILADLHLRNALYKSKSLLLLPLLQKIKPKPLFSRNVITIELQWLEHWWLVYHGCFKLDFESLGTNPTSANLIKLRVIFLFISKMVYSVYSLERLDEAILMRTHNIPSCQRKSNRYTYFASWLYTMINIYWLELPLSRTYFHGSRGVRAIEVLLYSFSCVLSAMVSNNT